MSGTPDYSGTAFNSSATGSTYSFNAANLDGPGRKEVAQRVTDAAGNTNITYLAIQITDVSPTATLTGSTVTLGSAGSINFSNSMDPSPADTTAGFTYSYDFNDDGINDLTTTAASAVVPESYLSTIGVHTIVGTIADKDGGFNTYTTIVSVNTVSTQLSGTIIGTSGSYNNDGNTIAKAFDSNFTTFFDAPTASGSWAGLDFGSPKIITQVSYASRSGYASRMNSGIFQGSNSSNFSTGVANLYIIGANANVPSGSLTNSPVNVSTPYRYVRYIGPVNADCNVAELAFYGYSPAPARVTGAIFNSSSSTPSLVFTLSNSLAYDPGISAIDLENVTTATFIKVPTSSLAENYVVSNNAVTVTFPGFTGGQLPAGIYMANLIANNVTDSNGLHPSSNASFSFLTVPGNGKLTLAAGRGTVEVQQVSIQSGGLLDLANNNLILAGGSSAGYSNLLGSLQGGYQNGSWQGTSGIASSSAASDSSRLTTLGLVFSTGQTFEAQSTQFGDVLLKYTYFGDANFDGKVDGSDYSRIDSGYLTHATGWSNGDFNYDGVINGSDYTFIDNAFNNQGESLASLVASSSTNSIGDVTLRSAVPQINQLVTADD